MYFDTIGVQSQYEKDTLLKSENVECLLKWLESQPHLPQMTELQIIFFLHSCYYDLDDTKTTIERHFKLRTASATIFDTPSISGLEKAFQNGILRILPKKTPEGYSVLLAKLVDLNVETYDCANFFKLFNMSLALDLFQNGINNGVVVVFDSAGMSFGHFMRINWGCCKTMASYLQEGAPVRLKALHFINVVYFLQKAISCARPLLKKELMDMMHFHHHMDSLYQHVPPANLPVELGGGLPPISELIEDHRQNILDNMQLFKWLDAQKMDESRRTLQNGHSSGGIFGFWR